MNHKIDHWKITISDPFCTWEYDLPTLRDDISIHDVYELVRKRLGSPKLPGRLVKKEDK